MISELITPESESNNPQPTHEGMLGVHPVALLSADPLNVSELCGWNAVLVPRWISSDPGYGTRHTVGLNVWGRDDYTVSQVSARLFEFFHCATCEGLGVHFMGPQPSKDGFYLAVFTLSWRN
jgi:hypothetical protein